MSRNPAQLFLLADHIKLSLLERQRAISLKLEPSNQDGQISRSLDSLQQGIEALETQAQQWDDPLHPSEEQSTYVETIQENRARKGTDRMVVEQLSRSGG